MQHPTESGASFPGIMSVGQPGSHPDEETLELYCLSRLDEERAAPVEEHLFLCESCRQRAESLDQFIRAARAAAAGMEFRAKEPVRERQFGWFAWPALAAAGALAGVLVISVPDFTGRPAGPAQTVELSSFRGVESLSAAAQAGRALDLRIDMTGVDRTQGRTAAIFDAAGDLIVRQSVEWQDGRAVLAYARGLKAGQYWVRIEGPDGETVRETGLRIHP